MRRHGRTSAHGGHHQPYSPVQNALCKRWDTPQKTQRSCAFPPTLCHRVARIFLTAPLSYEAVALHRGQCDTLLRYGKLATSSVLVEWHGFQPHASGFVPLSMAEFSL